jgi:cupin 2 domain-containing protein
MARRARLTRGKLEDRSAAPVTGETFLPLLTAGNVRIEQILSGATEAASYQQNHDEWVVVLCGGAGLEVGDETIDLGPGEWVLLPAGLAHRVVRTDPATSWLAVHIER